GKRDRFICAAGILAHYIGDACQPLHISFLHHGDQEHPVTRVIVHKRGKNKGKRETVNVSQDVHADYEANVFKTKAQDMKTGVQRTIASRRKAALVHGGREAGLRTIAMMQSTFTALPPASIVKFYDAQLRSGVATRDRLEAMWSKFGKKTI